jgi:hypothetical protein
MPVKRPSVACDWWEENRRLNLRTWQLGLLDKRPTVLTPPEFQGEAKRRFEAMAPETIEERSSRSCGNLIVDHFFLQATQPSVGRESGVHEVGRWRSASGRNQGRKEGGSSGLVSRVNPSACPYQRFSFIEINFKKERTHENAATNAGVNQSSQTVPGGSWVR